jgi:adenylate cyclase
MPLRKRRRGPDFAREGLLKGLRGNRRAARLELLEYLYRQGVSIEDLRRAVGEDRLAILPAERLLEQAQKYTIEELARKAGIDAEEIVAQRRAAGLPVPEPPERAYSDEDVEAARRLRSALEMGLPRDAMLEGARLFGRAAAQAAVAARTLVAEALIQPGDTERDLGLRLAEAARTLHPQTVETLSYLYVAHLRELLRSDVIAASDLASGTIEGTREVAVCFADLVGFTRLGQRAASQDLGAVAERLRVLAHDAARPPVSLVKTIGDAALLVSPNPEALLDAALSLVEAADAEGDGFPQVKVGAAYGEAVNRWGDWYGSPVNVASRVTGLARPASVLATAELHDVAHDGFRWSHAGRHRLKGVREGVTLYRCRRTAGEAAPAPEAQG